MWLALILACTPENAPAAAQGDTSADDTGGAPAAPRRPALCLNELMPVNLGSVVDELGRKPDWLELHNPTGFDVPLDGWTLTNDPDKPDLQALDGLSVAAGGFLLLWADAHPELGATHLRFALDGVGGSVGLRDPNGHAVLLQYGEMESDTSIARVTDCCESADCFTFTYRGSPGASNEAAP